MNKILPLILLLLILPIGSMIYSENNNTATSFSQQLNKKQLISVLIADQLRNKKANNDLNSNTTTNETIDDKQNSDNVFQRFYNWATSFWN